MQTHPGAGHIATTAQQQVRPAGFLPTALHSGEQVHLFNSQRLYIPERHNQQHY